MNVRCFSLLRLAWLFAGVLTVANSSTLRAAVDAAIPRPEHPRPDARRDAWLSLNGPWQFAIDTRHEGAAQGWTHGHDLPLTIMVPFPPQSQLSGLARVGDYTDLWYRRMFTVPASMAAGRVRLHFGAVDYRTEVYVNGVDVGGHVGGSAAFAFDITSFLKGGENELVVRVHDDLRDGVQPKGKQALKSEGCFYTATSGLWQTVWLEGVGRTFIRQHAITTDIDAGSATIAVDLGGDDADVVLRAEAGAGGHAMGAAETPLHGRHGVVVIPLREKHLWGPGHPFLYDVTLTLRAGDRTIDQVSSYFGLRSVAISGRRILINGEPVFQRLILDQGFYPDGIWTAPSDAALRHDIEMSMAAGFNGARLHQKVFEPRFLYWADKLGYLVWGEFPNWGLDPGPASHAPYVAEWTEVIQRDRNHPALIGWCPFNETGFDAGTLQQVVWDVTRALDPTRPVIESSGWTHTVPHPEVLDSHDYDQNPVTFRQRWHDYFTQPARLAAPPRYGWGTLQDVDGGVPFMVSEYGGIGWTSDGGWGYGQGPKTLDEFYARYQGLTDALLDNPNLFGFCYTQLTDVEQERNGLYTYDRRPKFDVARLHAITSRQAAYERGEPSAPLPPPAGLAQWRIVVGGAPDGADNEPYRIAEDEAAAEGWTAEAFDDSAWSPGRLPLGITSWRHPATIWKNGGRRLRRHFSAPAGSVRQAGLVLVSTSAVEVYLNGELLLRRGPTLETEMADVTGRFAALVRPGDNIVAIRLAPGTTTEPYFDAALLVR